MPRSAKVWRKVALHFVSRSQMKIRCPLSTPSSADVSTRATWPMNASPGCGVDPTRCTARLEFDDKERVVRDQAADGPHLGREEVCGDDRAPMGGEKRTPGHRALRHGANPLAPEDWWRSWIGRRDGQDSSTPPGSCGSPTSDSPVPSGRSTGGSRGARPVGLRIVV